MRPTKDGFAFTPVIVEKTEVDKDGKEGQAHVLYATNLPDKVARAPGFDMDELYDKRWDIEAHYRKLEEVRPRTVSRDRGSRTFFFFMGAALLNARAMYNQRQKEANEEGEEANARRAPGEGGRGGAHARSGELRPLGGGERG